MRRQPNTSAKSDKEQLQARDRLHKELVEQRKDVEHLRAELGTLRAAYQSQLGYIKTSSANDVSVIRDLRSQAERLVKLIQGGSLFGRYAQDAESHAIVANRWRRFAVLVLLMTAVLEVALVAGPTSLEGLQLVAPLAPLLLLFTYASIESHNHRRSELNRRRIYLRMAAIESYTEREAEGISSEQLEGILRDFIEQHFIAPDLDPNDVSSVGAQGFGPVRFFTRSARS